jgi:hypothetical protein
LLMLSEADVSEPHSFGSPSTSVSDAGSSVKNRAAEVSSEIKSSKFSPKKRRD